MNLLRGSLRAACVALALGTALAPAPASATGRGRVALQVTGMRIGAGLPHAPTRHAVARDVWPGLVRCAAQSPAVRGRATVTVASGPDGRQVTLAGPVLAADTPLRRCVLRAARRLALPATEEPPADARVALELLFDLPQVPYRAPAPRRQGTHARGRAPRAHVAHAPAPRPAQTLVSTATARRAGGRGR